jgi:hypothetical protein
LLDGQIFTINSKSVVHENLDGEVILVHLETGVYYSLSGTATEIWTLLGHPMSADEIVEALLKRYHGNHDELKPAVVQFLRELQSEFLVVPDGKITFKTDSPSMQSLGDLPFAAPRLEKYTDMQEFLQVDPIHEVTQDGWPHRRTE